MDFLVKFASAFMGVFQLGGEQFMGWVTGIIPTILMLLVMMNAVIALIDRSHREGLHQQPSSALRSTPLALRFHARQPYGSFHGQVHA